jgi:hypothetical protein
MAVSYGPTPPPQPNEDRTFGAAVEDAQKDYARLTFAHEFSWSIDLSGGVIWRCKCSELVARNSMTANQHILQEVRKARGPIRPPTK